MSLLQRVLDGEWLTIEQGVRLWEYPLDELIATANSIRQRINPGQIVTWQIDRNINITNICHSRCLFCNFHAGASKQPFITTKAQYSEKIHELIKLGGDQILLQGGLHPRLGLPFYEDLFRWLKSEFPTIKVHALSPPEVAYIAKNSELSTREVLLRLIKAGLDSLPGGGAEILSERPRAIIAPRKCTANEWLSIMGEAHQMGLLTSATMMYGHIETIAERMEHLVRLRELQGKKPKNSSGFMAFIPWPFQGKGTQLEAQYGWQPTPLAEHIRMVAIARIMLPNIQHIQASWLTVGVDAALTALHAGADDMGSIMVEENVIASTGTRNTLSAEGMVSAIKSAGFTPTLRDQRYAPRALPAYLADRA